MNTTTIETFDLTYNPVTGCLHGCEYCYARDFAQRFCGADMGDTCRYGAGYDWYRGDDPFAPPYTHTKLFVVNNPLMVTRKNGKKVKAPFPFGFEPTYHKYRLNEPKEAKRPQNIFVCSMADLFGSWVPTKWIADVIDSCLAAPQHNYLFLTKNPARYAALQKMALLPQTPNFWYGTTITNNADFDGRGYVLYSSLLGSGCKTFLSIEPLHEQISLNRLPNFDCVQWVIVGAESGKRKGKVMPSKAWVDDIREACEHYGIPLFMKDSLIPVVGRDGLLQEWPEELRKDVAK
jgi:protein gp37